MSFREKKRDFSGNREKQEISYYEIVIFYLMRLYPHNKGVTSGI